MFTRIGTFCYKAIQSKWINIICFPIFGIFLITEGYAFLQDGPGHLSGMLYVISGSLWILCAVFELLSHYLNVVSKTVDSVITAILSVITAILAISAAVLTLYCLINY